MYQVFCRSSRRGCHWVPYSSPFPTREEAEACKARAEARKDCDLYDFLLQYQVRNIATVEK